MSFAILMKALDLAAAEIPVFPCAADKRPTCAHGFKDATCEPEAIRALWCNHPGPLIGVPTGAASGFFVLDIDSAKHIEADEWLERHAPYFPETREHRTKSGGLHILFKHRDGLKNTASKIARGIDTRGEGGYIIWWPAAIPQSADGRNPPIAIATRRLPKCPNGSSRRLLRRLQKSFCRRDGRAATSVTQCPGCAESLQQSPPRPRASVTTLLFGRLAPSATC